jgi:hypothetical protein
LTPESRAWPFELISEGVLHLLEGLVVARLHLLAEIELDRCVGCGAERQAQRRWLLDALDVGELDISHCFGQRRNVLRLDPLSTSGAAMGYTTSFHVFWLMILLMVVK